MPYVTITTEIANNRNNSGKQMDNDMQMKKKISIIVTIVLIMAGTFSLCGCGGAADYDPLEGVETVEFTDDCGRTVEIPKTITKCAPSGSVSQMVIMTIAPETMVGLSSTPSTETRDYFPEEMWTLPTFGQFYGSKANLNMEELIAAQPQVILDIGDKKETHKADMDKIQEQTGIPTIFIETSLEKFPDAYRTLGTIFGKEEEGEVRAEFIEETLATAEKASAKIPEKRKQSVYYGTGTTGLDCNAAGSVQADVIDVIGAVNAVSVPEDEITDKGGGTLVSLEEIYTDDPDVVILTEEGAYESIKNGENDGWNSLRAIKENHYYEIPCIPYCWMSGPPSINRVLGIYWLGQLVYPEYYNNYDMVDKTMEFYEMFYNKKLTEDEAKDLLKESIFKK